jgi:thermitase
MKIMFRLIAIIIVFCLAMPGAFAFEDPAQPRRPGAVLYKIREGASPNELKALNGVLHSLGAANQKYIKGPGISLDVYTKGNVSEEAAARMIMKSGAVEFAEPDYLVEPGLTPNDPYYTSQWQHKNINSPSAWNTTTGRHDVIVAVCDTGISSNHPDLAPNLILPGYNSADGSNNTDPVLYHGTGVAGCIGAVGNNAVGVSGVAWNIGILPIRITNSTDGMASISAAANGIRYAADQGARVVNLSYRMAAYSTIDTAAKYLREKGGLLFVAAGNDGKDPGWPDFESFIAVGATTSSDTKASWSNYGTYIDIVAPGSNVYSTTGASSYGSMSGTSFASPIAAGVAALAFSFNPSLTPDQVESFIFGACKDLGETGEDNIYGHGLVNAAGTLALAGGFSENYAPVAHMTIFPETGRAPLEVAVNAEQSYDPDGEIITYRWNFGDGATASGINATNTYKMEGPYTLTLTVTDNMGAVSTKTAQVKVDPASDPVPEKVIYVEDIWMSVVTLPGGEIARAWVILVDENGMTVPGVLVTGWWSGLVTGTSESVTRNDGVAVLDSKKFRKTGTITFTVTGLTGDGYTYDPSLNESTEVSIMKQ